MLPPSPTPPVTHSMADTLLDRVVRLVGPSHRVLLLRAGTGDLAHRLAANGCRSVGVEADPDDAARAAEFCERVIVGDPATLDYSQELGDDRLDVIVAVDVLEHLKDPLAVLTSLRPFLRLDGRLVTVLPNIAHGTIRLALLSGRFPDTASVRFFTHASLERLLEAAGFVIGQLERETAPLDGASVPQVLSNGLLDALRQDPEAQTARFIVAAYPLPRADLEHIQQRIRDLVQARTAAETQVAALQADHAAAQAEIAQLTAQHAAAQAQIAQLQAQQAKLEAELRELRQLLADQTADLDALSSQVTLGPQREIEMRAMLMSAHDKLLQRDEETFKLRRDLTNAFETIRWMESSRSWQLIQQTWSIRNRLRALLRR